MTNSIEIFQSDDGQLELKVAFDHDTVWLAQDQLCELFGRERSVITKHINNVFREGELERDSVCAKFARTAQDGKIYQTQHYNLDVIISVGYRVKSPRGVQFRQWASCAVTAWPRRWRPSNRALVTSCFIPMWPAGRPICSILSSRITRWLTATSAAVRSCSCGIYASDD